MFEEDGGTADEVFTSWCHAIDATGFAHCLRYDLIIASWESFPWVPGYEDNLKITAPSCFTILTPQPGT